MQIHFLCTEFLSKHKSLSISGQIIRLLISSGNRVILIGEKLAEERLTGDRLTVDRSIVDLLKADRLTEDKLAESRMLKAFRLSTDR